MHQLCFGYQVTGMKSFFCVLLYCVFISSVLTETHGYFEWTVNVTLLCELSHCHTQY